LGHCAALNQFRRRHKSARITTVIAQRKNQPQTALFRAVWVMIFCGGIGQLISLLLVGMPPAPFIGLSP
jgi:Domain of unknown function (DUF4345)